MAPTPRPSSSCCGRSRRRATNRPRTSSRPASPRTPCPRMPRAPMRTSRCASRRSCRRWRRGGWPRQPTCAEGIARLAASDVVGVALATAAVTLGRPLPPARALVDAGGLLALATDFNPGSSPCDSLPAVMHLAVTQCHITPAEALSAVTVNAAHVLGIGDRAGRLRVGQRAGIALLDVPDWRYLAYRLGSEGVKHVIVEGVWALEG